MPRVKKEIPTSKKAKSKEDPLPFVDISRLAELGLTLEQIGYALGMSKKTLQRRMNENEEVKDAMEIGRAKALVEVARTAYQMAKSGDEPAMTMFYLKCRGGWREVQKIEHTGQDGKPIENKITVVLEDYCANPNPANTKAT